MSEDQKVSIISMFWSKSFKCCILIKSIFENEQVQKLFSKQKLSFLLGNMFKRVLKILEKRLKILQRQKENAEYCKTIFFTKKLELCQFFLNVYLNSLCPATLRYKLSYRLSYKSRWNNVQLILLRLG